MSRMLRAGWAARSLLPPTVSVLVAATMLVACAQEEPSVTNELSVTSSAFSEGGAIPTVHTCDGDDRSPPLEWSGAPVNTAAFAILVEDQDANGFVHWAVADIPAGTTSLAEGQSAGTEGLTGFGRTGYGGPCPPSGTHRYVFTIFALNEPLGLDTGFSADELLSGMQGRVIGTGRLTGTYQRDG